MTTSAAYRSIVSSCLTRARTNLFNSWRNSVLSLATIAAGGIAGFLMLRFVLFQANWGLVAINRKLFFVGSYPAEDTFRIWISLFIVVILVALTYGVWIGRLRPYIVAIGVVAVITLTLGLGTDLQIQEGQYTQEIQSAGQTAIVSGVQRELVWERGWAPRWLYSLSLGLAIPFGTSWLLLAGLFAVLIGGAWAGRRLSRWRSNPILLQAIGAAWVLLIPMIVLLQLGVSSSHWESAFLDLLVFAVGGFFSFVIGLGLALGRTSPYWTIRFSAVGYIEVVRAAPLLVWLLFATFLDDEFGPIGEAFSNIDLVYRVMIVFAFFGGAYIAEVLRGGLQSIPRGQHEASEAIGLSAAQKYIFIILPQAIKAVIPAIIGRFIALWKDTALLAAISLVNTLEKAKEILGGQTDIAEGAFFEIYIVVGLIYWLISYLLSRLGGAAETRLGVNTR